MGGRGRGGRRVVTFHIGFGPVAVRFKTGSTVRVEPSVYIFRTTTVVAWAVGCWSPVQELVLLCFELMHSHRHDHLVERERGG